MFGVFKGIRFISRWVYRTVAIVLVLLVAAILLRDPLLQSLTERRIHDCTGLDARMKDMDVGLLQHRVALENLKIYSTAEYGGGVMLDVEELHFEIDADAFKRGELHFKLIRIDLNLLNIVVDQKAKTTSAPSTTIASFDRPQQPMIPDRWTISSIPRSLSPASIC